MTAALHWSLIAIDERGHGHGTCGHEHPTDDECYRCEWQGPDGTSAFVRQMRTSDGRGPARPAKVMRARQLELFTAGQSRRVA
jgi:hypothetical protein